MSQSTLEILKQAKEQNVNSGIYIDTPDGMFQLIDKWQFELISDEEGEPYTNGPVINL